LIWAHLERFWLFLLGWFFHWRFLDDRRGFVLFFLFFFLNLRYESLQGGMTIGEHIRIFLPRDRALLALRTRIT
jgi:hypothetical protein